MFLNYLVHELIEFMAVHTIEFMAVHEQPEFMNKVKVHEQNKFMNPWIIMKVSFVVKEYS